MYTSLKIANFRAFRTLVMNGLKRVNLLTGRNNSGKTSVLEAVYLLEGDAPASRARQLFSSRGLAQAGMVHVSPQEMPWATLFRNLEVETDVELEGVRLNGPVTVKLSTRFEGPDRTTFVLLHRFTPDHRIRNVLAGRREAAEGGDGDLVWFADNQIHETAGDSSFLNLGSFLHPGANRSQQSLVSRFSELEIKRQDVFVVDALRIVEPRLRSLSTILSGGVPVLHADLEGAERKLPLAVVGEGMLRLLDIVFAISQNRRAAVMFDEIENGFHYSVLPKVWALIHQLAKQYEVQVFATTHSQECAAAAHQSAIESGQYDYQYFRIEQKEGTGRAVALTEEIVQTAIDAELELR